MGFLFGGFHISGECEWCINVSAKSEHNFIFRVFIDCLIGIEEAIFASIQG